MYKNFWTLALTDIWKSVIIGCFRAKDTRENGKKKQCDFFFSEYLPLIFKEPNISHNKDVSSKIHSSWM